MEEKFLSTKKDLLEEASGILKGLPDATLAAEVILAHCLGESKEKIFVDEKSAVEKDVGERFLNLVSVHARGEPVAYLTGVKEFYGLEFMVDRRVLIPRPETEHLVDFVLEKAGSEKLARVLDIGTGSGCIAVTLAKRNPELNVTACEVSADALEVARINAEKHGVAERVRFIESDLMENVSGEFDVIVANLPYIGREKFNFVSREAAEYEPDVALYGGADGLELYRKLFEQVAMLRNKPKYLAGEFGFLQGELLRDLVKRSFPGAEAEFRSDYASIERLFVIKFPSL